MVNFPDYSNTRASCMCRCSYTAMETSQGYILNISIELKIHVERYCDRFKRLHILRAAICRIIISVVRNSVIMAIS
jgi:hypothetical protein